MSEDSVDLAARLHSLGYRLTPQRQFVLEAVEMLRAGGEAR